MIRGTEVEPLGIKVGSDPLHEIIMIVQLGLSQCLQQSFVPRWASRVLGRGCAFARDEIGKWIQIPVWLGLARAHDDIMLPRVPHIVDVEKGRAPPEGKIGKSASRGVLTESVRSRPSKLTRLDLEDKEVTVEPVKSELDAAVELEERIGVRHAQLAPNRRLDVAESNAQD
jgi:hypothetical protein